MSVQHGCTNFTLFFLFLALASLLQNPTAKAQTSLDEVHITPRTATTPRRESIPLIKVESKLVLVPVTVTDGLNRVVTGLGRENFQVLEDHQVQNIEHFSSQDEPASVGIVFDTSTSMDDKIEWAREAVKAFVSTANPQDEFFLISFADRPNLRVDFTSSIEKIEQQLFFLAPKGRTALLDAVYLGLSKMRDARYSRKALVIISDGGDNHSRYTEREVRSLAKEADVLIYAAGIYDRYFDSVEEREGPALLNDLASLTGAQSFTVDSPSELPLIAKTIGTQLRNQYVLGYRPSEQDGGSIWKKIKVRLLQLPKGATHLGILAKSGYYRNP
jgi:Ca-activated chloride channel family protein